MFKTAIVMSFIPLSFAASELNWRGKRDRVIRNYLKIHTRFFKQLCRGGDHIYNRYNKEYRGEGLFLPRLGNFELDRQAIKEGLPLLKKRLGWIKSESKKLKAKKDFSQAKKSFKRLEKVFGEVAKIKEQFYLSTKGREVLLEQGRGKIGLLGQRMKELLAEISFLKPFGFPVDHFSMRKEYEQYKFRSDADGVKKKNSIRFQRKIFEDGAQNLDHTKSDVYFRAMINMLEIRLSKQDAIIDENFRYDMVSFLKILKRYLGYSKRFHLMRLKEWQERTQKALDFYLDISKKSRQNYAKSLLKNLSLAKDKLKKFNFTKQRKVYDFWLKESELNRALFVLETILFNEAGDIDKRNAPERKDIAQIVINRANIPFYRTIDEEGDLYPYLQSIGKEKLAKSRWANVMFKEGEFSFTYFFIPSSQKIYCPDQSRKGRFLRKENIKIALEVLKNPRRNFSAVRYFSRASMLGRIDMAKIWSDFRPLAERPGPKSVRSSQLRKSYRRKKYRFIYQFEDEQKKTYHVVEIANKLYTYDPAKRAFFGHRSPHFFRYFVPR